MKRLAQRIVYGRDRPWSQMFSRIGGWVSYLCFMAAVAVSVYHLSHVGWGRILEQLPDSPWFYGFFALSYLSLPVSELWVYRRIWRFPFSEGLRTFLLKRVYNRDLLGYSGEAYLFFWAQRRLGLPTRAVWQGIKDNNLLSAGISTLLALSLVGLLLIGNATLADRILPQWEWTSWAGLAVLGAILGVAGYRFRRFVFHLPGRVLLELASIHAGRLLLVHICTIGMWYAGAPGVPLKGLFTLLVVDILSARLPGLPGKEVLVMNLQVMLASSLNFSSASVAALLLTQIVLEKTLNVLVLALQMGNPDRRRAFKQAVSLPEQARAA
jgi:hypothetical protein